MCSQGCTDSQSCYQSQCRPYFCAAQYLQEHPDATNEESPYYSVDPAPAMPASTPTAELTAILLDESRRMFDVSRNVEQPALMEKMSWWAPSEWYPYPGWREYCSRSVLERLTVSVHHVTTAAMVLAVCRDMLHCLLYATREGERRWRHLARSSHCVAVHC